MQSKPQNYLYFFIGTVLADYCMTLPAATNGVLVQVQQVDDATHNDQMLAGIVREVLASKVSTVQVLECTLSI